MPNATRVPEEGRCSLNCALTQSSRTRLQELGQRLAVDTETRTVIALISASLRCLEREEIIPELATPSEDTHTSRLHLSLAEVVRDKLEALQQALGEKGVADTLERIIHWAHSTISPSSFPHLAERTIGGRREIWIA